MSFRRLTRRPEASCPSMVIKQNAAVDGMRPDSQRGGRKHGCSSDECGMEVFCAGVEQAGGTWRGISHTATRPRARGGGRAEQMTPMTPEQDTGEWMRRGGGATCVLDEGVDGGEG